MEFIVFLLLVFVCMIVLCVAIGRGKNPQDPCEQNRICCRKLGRRIGVKGKV